MILKHRIPYDINKHIPSVQKEEKPQRHIIKKRNSHNTRGHSFK